MPLIYALLLTLNLLSSLLVTCQLLCMIRLFTFLTPGWACTPAVIFSFAHRASVYKDTFLSIMTTCPCLVKMETHLVQPPSPPSWCKGLLPRDSVPNRGCPRA